MFKKIKSCRFTIGILTLLGLAAIASLFQEIGSAMSGSMVQIGWCAQGDAYCLLGHYIVIAVILIAVGMILDFVSRNKWTFGKNNIRGDIDFKKLRLAKGCFINYPKHNYYNVTMEEITLTLINETGQDLKKCFVLLDEVAIGSKDGMWKIEVGDIFDRPFRWVGDNVLVEGKLDIDNDDRASFALISSTCYPALNVTENRNEWGYNFGFAFFGGDTHSLAAGSNYRLAISIRGRYNSDKRNFVPVKYYIYVRLRQGAPSLERLKMERPD